MSDWGQLKLLIQFVGSAKEFRVWWNRGLNCEEDFTLNSLLRKFGARNNRHDIMLGKKTLDPRLGLTHGPDWMVGSF